MALDLIGTEFILLAPTLAPKLEEHLFDPVEDAGIERSLAELGRRVDGWDIDDRTSLAFLQRLDETIIDTMHGRFVGRIESCPKLFAILSDWTYVAARSIEEAPPEEIEQLRRWAGYGAEAAARLIMLAARRIRQEDEVVLRLATHLPARVPPTSDPTVH